MTQDRSSSSTTCTAAPNCSKDYWETCSHLSMIFKVSCEKNRWLSGEFTASTPSCLLRSCRVYRIPPDSPDILQSSCVKMSPMKINRCKESLTTFKLSHFFYFIVTVQCWAKLILRFLTDLHKPPRSAPLGRFPSWLYLSKNGAISVSPPL